MMQRTILNLETKNLFNAINKNESSEEIKKLLKDTDNVNLTALENDNTIIQLAAGKRRWDIVEAIAGLKGKVNTLDEERFGDALRYSVIYDKYETARVLLKANASTRWFSTKNGNRILHSAATNNNSKMIKLLMEYPHNLYIENEKKEIPLEIALNKSYWDCAKVFLEDKSFTFKNKKHRNEKEESRAFIRAVGDGEIDLAKLLFAADIHHHIRRGNGNNILHHVVKKWKNLKPGQKNLTLLYALDHGGDQTTANQAGKTPIELASELGHWDCVKLLLEESNQSVESLHLNNVLINAIKDNHYQITELLLQRGADCNVISENGNSALYWAIKTNHQSHIFSLLLKYNANPKIKDKWGNNIIDLARDSVNPVFLDYLDKKEYTIFEKDMNVKNLVDMLSNRLKLFKHTHPPKYKRTVEQYNNEANICFMALNLNSVKTKDLSMVFKHSANCIKEVVNHYSNTLLKNSISETSSKNDSKEIELLKTVNDLLNFRIKNPIEKCQTEEYKTPIEKQLSLYINQITKMIHYRERLRIYLENLNKTICDNTWYVKDLRTIFTNTWVKGTPEHIKYLKEKLKVLSSDASFYSVLNLYMEVMMKLDNIEGSNYRHPATEKFYQEEISKMLAISFIPQEAPSAFRQVVQAQKAIVNEKELHRTNKRIISPLPYRSNNSLYPNLQSEITKQLAQPQPGFNLRENNFPEYPKKVLFNSQVSERANEPPEYAYDTFAALFPSVPTDTVRVYNADQQLTLYSSQRVTQKVKPVVANQESCALESPKASF